MPETININGCSIKLIKGDITDLEVEAFVFYARNDLELGSGFGNAISMRGGPSIKKELTEIGPLKDCEAVVSKAGELKSNYIVHAVGPKFQEAEMVEKLEQTIKNALEKAHEKNIKQLAFPAMGTGFYGVLLPVSADVTLNTLKVYLGNHNSFEEIIICLLSNREYKPFQAALENLN